MKMFKKILVSTSLLACAGVAIAQPAAVIGTGNGQPGNTVSISVDYVGTGSGVVGVQFDVDASADFGSISAIDLTNCGGTLNGASITCADQGSGVVRLAGFQGALQEIPDGSLGTIGYTIDGAVVPPATIDLLVAGEVYSDAALGSVPPNGSVDGVINVTSGPQPAYTSTPAAGSTFNFGPALAGSGNLSSSLTITNSGEVGSTLNTTCTLSGADAGQFSVDASLSAAIAQGASVNGNVTCNDPGIGNDGTFTASLDCAHDGTSPASPVSYPLSCVFNPPFAQINPTPTDGTPRNIVVAGLGASGNTSVTFTETSNDGVDGAVSCSISGADAGLFTITAPAAFPATVVSGGSVQVTVNGTEPGTGGAVAAALDCSIDDGVGGTSNVSFPLGFIVQPQVVPTMSQIGMILMGLFLAGVGFMTLRRKATV